MGHEGPRHVGFTSAAIGVDPKHVLDVRPDGKVGDQPICQTSRDQPRAATRAPLTPWVASVELAETPAGDVPTSSPKAGTPYGGVAGSAYAKNAGMNPTT